MVCDRHGCLLTVVCGRKTIQQLMYNNCLNEGELINCRHAREP